MIPAIQSDIKRARAMVNVVQDICDRPGSKPPSKDVQVKALEKLRQRGNNVSVGVSRAIVYNVQDGAPQPYMVALYVQGKRSGKWYDEHIIDARCSCPASDVCNHLLVALASAEMSTGLRLAR